MIITKVIHFRKDSYTCFGLFHKDPPAIPHHPSPSAVKRGLIGRPQSFSLAAAHSCAAVKATQAGKGPVHILTLTAQIAQTVSLCSFLKAQETFVSESGCL